MGIFGCTGPEPLVVPLVADDAVFYNKYFYSYLLLKSRVSLQTQNALIYQMFLALSLLSYVSAMFF